MYFKSILGGTLATLFVVTAPASGFGRPAASESAFSFHLPKFDLPGVFGEKEQKPVQLAQQAGTTGLEEQIRTLNGRIEELNFQVLQMQEQIRKQQEDNEFRFQQLEQGSGGAQQGTPKRSDASDDSGGRSIAEVPATGAPAAGPSGQTVEGVIAGSGETGNGATGAPPKTFGTITVDKNGNVVQADGNTQAIAPAQMPAPDVTGASENGGAVVAALPATDDPDELYRNSYQFILSGDYGTAEQGFRDHISRFPKDKKAADAHYWLGEALLGQQKYRDAAETFLAASKSYPKAKKAPDMLLKLGVALKDLNQRDVACATFGEIGKRYPDISSALKERVKQERALASC